MISIKRRLVSIGATLLLAPMVAAADAYYHLPVASVTLTQGAWPSGTEGFDWRHREKAAAMKPYVVLDGDQAYLAGYSSVPDEDRSADRTISLRVP